jgi:hypothetical protein
MTASVRSPLVESVQLTTASAVAKYAWAALMLETRAITKMIVTARSVQRAALAAAGLEQHVITITIVDIVTAA